MTVDLRGRCGTCARFARVREHIDENGEVRRAGDCLLGVWTTPILFETNTCSQYVERGTPLHTLRKNKPAPTRARAPRALAEPRRVAIEMPEELMSMNADEFRSVLREVIRDELGVGQVAMGGRWEGGEVIMKPGKDGTAEKRIPIESLFHKIVMVRDKLRVLEQKINSHPQLSDEEKVQMQQYVTQCYGSLTTFNVLFANKDDQFVGQRGDKD